MYSARDEGVRALVREIYAAGQESGLHGCNIMLPGYEKKYTDAIMSAFKRVPGVVVSDGFADLIDILERHIDEEHYTAADALDDLSKARAVVWRITSAVEPSPVVITAEMARRLEPLLPPFSASPKELSEAITAVLSPRSEEERWAEVEAVIQARDERKKREEEVRTAALSSRTEEEPKVADLLAEINELRERLHTKHSEIRADERERLAKLSDDEADALIADAKKREAQGRSKAGCDAMRARARLLRFFAERARSLTNGGG